MMTPEEALKEIHEHCERVKEVARCGQANDCDTCYIPTAIAAIEKQIPKKPQKTESFIRLFHCSLCGNLVCDQRIEGDQQQYCERCGQCLEWEEEK